MKNNIDEQLKEDILEIIKKSPIYTDPLHHEATLKWVLFLKPDADLALQIAAFGHDIDRAVNQTSEKDRTDDISYEAFKNDHAERSAKIMRDLLAKHNYGKEIINRVVDLVSKHEIGGEGDEEILKDADSIAYFEHNIPMFIGRYGEEKTRHKIHFMFDRASARAQEIIRQMKIEDPEIKKLLNEEIS